MIHVIFSPWTRLRWKIWWRNFGHSFTEPIHLTYGGSFNATLFWEEGKPTEIWWFTNYAYGEVLSCLGVSPEKAIHQWTELAYSMWYHPENC